MSEEVEDLKRRLEKLEDVVFPRCKCRGCEEDAKKKNEIINEKNKLFNK